ncbi:hypothetical protein [Bradyrhizobium centrolobii]|uniref:hypothetical protein n=1 Tax=Bradyrhizobium centrolobii TaxID=1505087 RepID=UPI001FDA9415|nr:hypothetical protein [Bradyrhizobium centrolobii]
MAEQNSELVEILIHQLGKNADVDPILGKTLCVLPKPQILKPLRDLLHRHHRRSGWQLAEFWITACRDDIPTSTWWHALFTTTAT